MTEGKEQHEEEESKTTKKDVVEEKSLDMEAEKEKEEDEHEDDEESRGDDDEAFMLVIKNAWRDLADTPAAFPPQLNMDECPPLRGFEGTPHAICRSWFFQHVCHKFKIFSVIFCKNFLIFLL